MGFTKAVRYIDSDELVGMLRNPHLRPRIDYVVIDVRDDDFAGGNIPSAVNIPAYQARQQMSDLVRRFHTIPKVIFHCALSQVRGPKVATAYHTLASSDTVTIEHGMSDEEDDRLDADEQEVLVLRGGFHQWQSKYLSESDLVENHDPDMYEERVREYGA